MRKVVGIYFNDKSEAQLLHFAQQQENFSGWVKDRIRENVSPSLPPGMEKMIKEMIEKQMSIFDFVPKQDDGLRNDLEEYF